MISRDSLQQVLGHAPKLRIALVGDLFLDRYLEIAAGVFEESIETGLEAYQIDQVRNAPGALGTVMNNLAALGVGQLLPVTVIGDDGHGYDLLQQLHRMPVDSQYVVRSSQRLTPTYTKPLRNDSSGEPLELNRLDVRDRGPLTSQDTASVLQRLEEVVAVADGLIVLDQINESNWGVINKSVRDWIAALCRSRTDFLVFVDSRSHLSEFQAGILKGNQQEFRTATGVTSAAEAARRLARRTGCVSFCTCGEMGTTVAHPDGRASLVAGKPVVGPTDIVGAGDAATSGMVTSLLSGTTPEEAAAVGNVVASITVQQLGTTGTATPAQVLARHAES